MSAGLHRARRSSTRWRPRDLTRRVIFLLALAGPLQGGVSSISASTAYTASTLCVRQRGRYVHTAPRALLRSDVMSGREVDPSSCSVYYYLTCELCVIRLTMPVRSCHAHGRVRLRVGLWRVGVAWPRDATHDRARRAPTARASGVRSHITCKKRIPFGKTTTRHIRST